jgi:hypothetical protein
MNGQRPVCCGRPNNRRWRRRSPPNLIDIRLSRARAGFAKHCWGRSGGGKRGGVRVVYYFLVRPDLIFLADLYPKNEKENLTHAERNELQKIASEIQREFGG